VPWHAVDVTTENRGVPGSSPGVAIDEGPAKRRFVLRVVRDAGSAPTLPWAFSGLFSALRRAAAGSRRRPGTSASIAVSSRPQCDSTAVAGGADSRDCSLRPTEQRTDARSGAPGQLLFREAGVSPCTPAGRPEEACRERRRDASIRRQAGLLGQHARCWRDEEPALTAACRAQARVAAVRREPTSSSIALAAALAPPAAR
jgi:hypothetical protein